MNLTQLLAAVNVRGFETDTSSQATAALNEVQRRVAGMHRWPWLRTDSTITLVAGTSTYSTPADWMHTIALYISGPSPANVDELEWLDHESFTYEQLRNTQISGGVPMYWTGAYSAQIRVTPTPTAAGTLRLVYQKTATDLVSGSDVSVIPVPYHDVLVLGACAILAQRQARWDAAQAWGMQYENRLHEMMAQTGLEKQQGGRRVIQSGFHEAVGRRRVGRF